MQDIKINDILQDGSVVTAKIKVTSENLNMYNLNGIIVSESHIIKYRYNWISVREHPLAIKLQTYTEPYLYCLNTTSKIITLNKIIFTDWDEVYDDTLDFLGNYMYNNKINKINNVYEGFDKTTKIMLQNEEKELKDIRIGDILSTGGIVYGTVELNPSGDLGNKNTQFNLLVSNGIFKSGFKTYPDYNNSIDAILELRKILSKEYV